MNHRARRIVETAACERRYGIADAKGSEYSGAGSTYKEDGADTLRNFKAVAERIGGSPEQVLLTYLLKHIDSITTTVREAGDPFYSEVGQELIYAKGEGIVSRMDDARNYLDLLECLLIDNGHIVGLSVADPAPVEIAEKWLQDNAACTVQAPDWRTQPMPMNNPNGENWQPNKTDESEMLARAGLVEGLDGVWRGATTIHESVRNPGERQVPIFAQPIQDSVRGEDVASTGELA